MSEDTPQPAPETADAPEAPVKDRSKAILMGLVGASLLLGGTVGAVVIAPRVRPAPAAVVDTVRTAPAAADPAAFSPGPTVRFDNLIVNPAGSQGARFLMVSLAVETADAKLETALRAREPQVRDLVIGLLERQSMDDLGRAGARDSIRRQLTDTLGAILASPGKLRVWLPQFVVQ